MNDLISRYKYSANYIPDYELFKKQVLNKSIIPHQVELQPGPSRGNICWLRCDYCYGGSAIDTGERYHWFPGLLMDIIDGGVNKIILAGYCTDPMNYKDIDKLLKICIKKNVIFGFNTKLINVSKPFIHLLTSEGINPLSYINVSVDAGLNRTYNLVHSVNGRQKLYDRVRRNLHAIRDARTSYFDISASYLLNEFNCSLLEVCKFVAEFKDAGCNLIRFSFPQNPRGVKDKLRTVPTNEECREYYNKLKPVIDDLDTPECRVIILDTDREHDIYRKPRTCPCVARWVYPTVGFDGWLYHCSQSSAPNFRKISLGKIGPAGFWDLFYNYNTDNMAEYFSTLEASMNEVHCRCDRKEHLLNGNIRGLFL